MLTLYRRHAGGCKFAADAYAKRCRCAMWARGVLNERPFRESLKVRSWERAEEIKRELEGSRWLQARASSTGDAR